MSCRHARLGARDTLKYALQHDRFIVFVSFAPYTSVIAEVRLAAAIVAAIVRRVSGFFNSLL